MPDDEFSAERAKQQFKGIIDKMKAITHEMMKTPYGRMGIRRDLGCEIEGFTWEHDAQLIREGKGCIQDYYPTPTASSETSPTTGAAPPAPADKPSDPSR